MKKLFFIISAVGFFLPFLLFIFLQLPYDNLKIFALFLLPKFNLIYFAIIIVFFFAGLKIKWLQLAQILFIAIYLIYLSALYFIFAPMHIKKYAKKYKNSKIVKITELKNFKNFKIVYKEGAYAVIIQTSKKHTNPFNYIKDRGQY